MNRRVFCFLDHDINLLGLPIQVILNPNTQEFGFVNITELVRSDFQVCMMWRGFAEINLKGLAVNQDDLCFIINNYKKYNKK